MSSSMLAGMPYFIPCAFHDTLPIDAPRLPGRRSASDIVSWSSDFDAGRVTRRRGKTKRGSSQQATRAPSISVSFPAPLGPTTRTSRPGPISAGPGERGAPGFDPPVHTTRCPARHAERTAGTPPATRTRSRSARLPRGDFAPVQETHSLCRRLRNGSDRSRQVNAGNPLREQQRRHQHAGRHIIRRQDVETPGPRKLGGCDVSGVRAAPHQVRCAHEHANAGGVQRLCRLDRGRKFRDSDPVANRQLDVLHRGVVMACQRR